MKEKNEGKQKVQKVGVQNSVMGRKKEGGAVHFSAFLCVFLCCVLSLSAFALSGCAPSFDTGDARLLFSEFRSVYGDFGAGITLYSDAQEWEKEYLSDEVIYSLYSDADGGCDYDLVQESAVFLSSSFDTYAELAVFICYGNTDTDAVAQMCARRIDAACRLRDYTDASAAENAKILTIGNAVIMCALPDRIRADEALRVLQRR
jgi:hypothetical protein